MQLGFLFEAYTNDAWWFELVDMGHKLLLTSVIRFLSWDTQVPAGLVVLVAYAGVLLVVKPYIRKGDDRLHLLAQVELFLLIYSADIIRTMGTDRLDQRTDAALSALLIIITLGFVVMFFVIAGRNIFKMCCKNKTKNKTPLSSDSSSGGDKIKKDGHHQSSSSLSSLDFSLSSPLSPLFPSSSSSHHSTQGSLDLFRIKSGAGLRLSLSSSASPSADASRVSHDADEVPFVYNPVLAPIAETGGMMMLSSTSDQFVLPESTLMGGNSSHSRAPSGSTRDEMELTEVPKDRRREELHWF